MALEAPVVEELGDLFKHFANPHRLRFLDALGKSPQTASRLARLSSISVQEAMRHLGRLRDLGLVDRDADRTYRLSHTGRLAVVPLTYYALLRSSDAFLREHDLRFVPPYLSLEPLLLAERHVGGEVEHLLALQQVGLGARQWVCGVAEQSSWGLAPDAVASAATAGFTSYTAVFSEAATRTEQFLRLPEFFAKTVPEFERARVRVYLTPEVPFLLTANEQEAVLFVRGLHGNLDLTTMLRSSSPDFRAWALGLFRHYEAQAVLAFDTARGDRLADWRAAFHPQAQRQNAARFALSEGHLAGLPGASEVPTPRLP